MSDENEKQPVYVMVPKKLVSAAVAVFVVLFLSNLGSYQYANYVDRQSNHRLCGIIVVSLKNAKLVPPTTEIQKQGMAAMQLLAEEFHCK